MRLFNAINIENIEKMIYVTDKYRHDHSCVICVPRVEVMLYLQGSAPQYTQVGECYNMAAGLLMAGVNQGTDHAVMHDIFAVPKRHHVWAALEDEILQEHFIGFKYRPAQ